ncbi:hypothetical protein GUITHDRAFT_149098 [Guillardia theta CCMP2712]|uniref:Uncharacterized protein n=1 Tax=Guillardia theta (strain CCMP2712) TaxID=905079 RepID=L1I7A6_GUITC|nr:hypothetical protein GUITHDRAFT_149098 [Guillardia theta CCMP2712]EKX31749.1 hypothetical protein GUITHDRAFT_149098 [Guillardia theta CCMP2712]|eukprot:XP_005818729.1 hypothetical protein GUITHDRAFT_149098 [Guillardia theta CCMP2712]
MVPVWLRTQITDIKTGLLYYLVKDKVDQLVSHASTVGGYFLLGNAFMLSLYIHPTKVMFLMLLWKLLIALMTLAIKYKFEYIMRSYYDLAIPDIVPYIAILQILYYSLLLMTTDLNNSGNVDIVMFITFDLVGWYLLGMAYNHITCLIKVGSETGYNTFFFYNHCWVHFTLLMYCTLTLMVGYTFLHKTAREAAEIDLLIDESQQYSSYYQSKLDQMYKKMVVSKKSSSNDIDTFEQLKQNMYYYDNLRQGMIDEIVTKYISMFIYSMVYSCLCFNVFMVSVSQTYNKIPYIPNITNDMRGEMQYTEDKPANNCIGNHGNINKVRLWEVAPYLSEYVLYSRRIVTYIIVAVNCIVLALLSDDDMVIQSVLPLFSIGVVYYRTANVRTVSNTMGCFLKPGIYDPSLDVIIMSPAMLIALMAFFYASCGWIFK